MKRTAQTLALALGLTAFGGAAHAHISISSGIGAANTTQEVAFGVGHGCAGADTVAVRVTIPAGVTSVRPMRSDFGKVSVEKDAAGTITAVSWTKATADALDADIAYYKLIVRLKTPNLPFTTLVLPALQTCRAMDGTMSTVDWKALPGAPTPDAGEDEPAPTLPLVPAHKPGWNKVAVPVALAAADLATYFADAQIVWKGTAAYSASATTTGQITATAGVTPLTALAAGDEIWVKY
jgi:uncharacterized protein YcnI